ncbi:hypothetical protein LXM94_06150 [Rhizobium sp. TRM95111]|uniref:hypothetical protein n=1 Tax=Rhizobium alarense TaxID=2846851 RepID=UPI001F31005F|nr:hypothetical protein [Rhizobium alarense]MCF3639547.1 hypothetical protein [Rhizobium alarense]
MIKLIATGVWVCIVTLASVYFSLQMAAAPKIDQEAADRQAALEVVNGNVSTIPVIADGEVKGHFLARLTYVANRELAAKQAVPVAQMITDQLYSVLIGKKMIDVDNLQSFDLDLFRKTVKDGLNERFGEEVVADVLVEQIDYITKAEAVNAAPKRGVTIAKGEVEAAEPSSSGH